MFEPYKKLLTIGIPAYNEEKYLKQTVESCVNQAGEVIISDNASTDGTQKICEELVKKYSNITYIRQKENIGGTANFNFVLNAAKTKYFMWLGSHDYLSENYSSNMIQMLENSNSAGSIPAARYVDKEGNEMGIYDCWFADKLTDDSAVKRVYALIEHLHDVSALFGIFKTEIAKKYPLKPMIGNDHEFVCAMASAGRMIFSFRSIYNWRQTKLGFSDEENIAAWEKSLGNSQNKIAESRKEMRDAQLKILKDAKFKGGILGYLCKRRLVCKAKKKLESRFGKE